MNTIISLYGRFIPPVPDQFAGRVRVQQVDTLANLGGAIGCVGVLAAFGIFTSFWHSAPHHYLVAFLGTFIVVYAAAFRRSVLWRKRPRPHDLELRAYRIRNLHVGVIGLLWSTMPVCLAPYADADQFLLIVYVSSGLIASSVVIAPTLLAAFLISVPVMAGTIVAMLTTRGSAGPTLAALIVIYSFLIFISTIHSHRSFIQRTLGKLELEEQREVVALLLREFEEESSDWLWRTDADNHLEHISERMIQVLGPLVGDLRGKDFVGLLSTLSESSAAPPAGARLENALRKKQAFRDLLLPVSVQGRHCWWQLTGKPIFDRTGRFLGFRGVGSDVTSTEESRKKIAYMASHDVLTGLPNRSKLEEALALKCRGLPRPFSLLWADLDRFKEINDTLGHAIGDALLKAVADRIRSSVDSGDVVARVGGDEFIILHTSGDQHSSSALASRIIESISAPYLLNDLQASVGVSIGICCSPDDATHVDDLLRYADLALYRAKDDGRGTWRLYEPEMDVIAGERRALRRDLRLALDRDQFSVVFQPIVDIGQSQVHAAEALLRWTHPDFGVVPPDRFISLAEETGLIVRIGAWVLHRACKEAMRWPEETCVAVNVSPVQFHDRSLPGVIATVLSSTGLPPARLILEITESVFLDANDHVLQTLHQLRKQGIKFALDDFGTGYSSLSYLRSFPFDKVKIDKSFVRRIEDEPSNLAIVRAIAGMAKCLGMVVIAEGVETEAELAVMNREGCTQVQGYIFSRPLSASSINQYIEAMKEEIVSGERSVNVIAGP